MHSNEEEKEKPLTELVIQLSVSVNYLYHNCLPIIILTIIYSCKHSKFLILIHFEPITICEYNLSRAQIPHPAGEARQARAATELVPMRLLKVAAFH